MSDYRSLLDRQMESMHPRPFPLEDLIRRRNRKQRVGRLVAVAVGLAIALIAAGAGSVFLRSSPVPAGPNPSLSSSHGNGALTYIGDHGQVVLLNRATGATRVLTPPNTSSFDWSPDGSQLAYALNQDGQCVLWVLDMRTNERRVLNTRTNERRPLVGCPKSPFQFSFDWSPDGNRLAFGHASVGAGAHVVNGIEVIDAGGGDPIRLSGPGRPFEENASLPTWSPDGTRLAFVSGVDVWVMDADGSNPHEIAKGAFVPAWSPDGSTIALLRDPLDPRGPSQKGGDPYVLQVWLVDADGGSGQRGQRLAEQRGCCLGAIPSLAWSPHGEKIALTGVEFWVIDVMDGSVRVVRLPVTQQVTQPAWRPAG